MLILHSLPLGQENFFKYMVESFGIDSITSYLQNIISDTSWIVNPDYRALVQEHKKLSAQLSKRKEIIENKKDPPKKVQFKDLEEEQNFDTSLNKRKFFLDLIKIIAYRAETALVNLIKKQMACPEQARSLIRKLYTSDADIQVDNDKQILLVKIHRTNHWADDKILEDLCQQLNQTQTLFPSTNLTISFLLLSS